MPLRSILSACLLCWPILLQAESPVFSTPFLAPLVGPKTINALHKDSSGFLWVGTESGLFRYDGSKITHFSADKGNSHHIPVSHISAIDELRDGRLAIATYGGGLLTWNTERRRFEASLTSSSGVQAKELYLKKMLIDSSDRIWLLSTHRAYIAEPKTVQEKALDRLLRNNESLRSPTDIIEAVNGNIFLATKSGIHLIDVNKTEVSATFSTNFRPIPTVLERVDDKSLYAGTDKGHLLSLAPNSLMVHSALELDRDVPVRVTAIQDTEDGIVVATDNGIFLVDQELREAQDISNEGHGLIQSDIASLLRDGNKFWIGTYRGLELLNFSNFELFHAKDRGNPGGVSGFLEDSDGRIWVATYNGLYYYDKGKHSHIRYGSTSDQVKLQDQRISSLSKVDDEIWVGFYSGGLQIFNILTEESLIPEASTLQKESFTRILHDSQRESVWLSSIDNGILRVSTSKDREWATFNYISGERVMDLLLTREGDVYAASVNKLYQYIPSLDDFKVVGRISAPDQFISIEITALEGGDNGRIWIGTADYGLHFLDRNPELSDSIILPAKVGSNFFKTVQAIESDRFGNIWCSTDNGLVKVSSDGEFIARFGKADGLQENDFEFGASFKDNGGILYFGGPHGYNRFDPQMIATNTKEPSVRLTGISFPSGPVSTVENYSRTENLILTYEDRSVTFNFSILDYTSPTRNQFRYQLEGFDDDWIESGSENFARYTNLPPGEFVFRVQAANTAGIWNTDGLAVNVSKSPPPWMTGWAFLIYAAVFALFWWASNRVYQSYTFKRKTVELQNQKLAQELRSHDEMQEQLEIQNHLLRSAHQHNLSTLSVLDTVMTPTATTGLEGDASHGLRWLEILRELENSIHYFADNPTADLNAFTHTMLSRTLEESSVPAHNIVTINDVTEKPVPTATASPLAIILYELIENSIKHAFSAEADVHYLQVRLAQKTAEEMDHYHWELQVIDNGVGLEPGEHKQGRGLQVVHSLVKSLGGRIEIETGHGTHITVRLPLHRGATEPESDALPA